jgi:hypothetical protein
LSRRHGWTLAAALAAVGHFASFDWQNQPLVTDVRHFVYFAQRVAGGAWPHVDFFEPKPPLAAALGAVLHRGGHLLGLEPLDAIRGGYLALAAAAATLSFAAHRRLGGDRVACGALALAFHCGFWLLGVLPSIGNVPKLAMAALATAAALRAHRRAWLAAGFWGGCAALDWQVGGLALLGVATAAMLEPATSRTSALGRVAAGGLMALLPLAALYAVRGAFDVLLAQVVGSALFRGASPRMQGGAAAEWARRWTVVAAGTDGHTWLLALATAGVPLFAWWVVRREQAPVRRLAAALGVHHFGILAFTLVDFQLFGDLFALLHTACFFAAITGGVLYQALEPRAAGRRWLPPVAAAVFCMVISRPWVDRGNLRPPGVAPQVTLASQRRVAARLAAAWVRPTTGALGATEQLFLAGLANPLPIVVWNPAVYSYYRARPAEPGADALQRIVEEAGVEWLVCDRGYAPCGTLASHGLVETIGDGSGYAVDLYARR